MRWCDRDVELLHGRVRRPSPRLRGRVLGLAAVTVGCVAGLTFLPASSLEAGGTRRLSSEVGHALVYARQCGGVVQVEPLSGGRHDVVVVGCVGP
jgi:hypothetical protein